MEHPFQFVVTGAGRGGTSLLAGLLASHPALQVGFEHHAGLLLGTGESADAPMRIEDRLNGFRRACEAEAAAQEKKWGNKVTTEQMAGLRTAQGGHVDVIEGFFRSLRDLKHVFILRDGRTCVRSKVKRTGQPWELACQRWSFSVEVYRYFLAGKIPNTVIRFEDLLARPEETLHGVCEFLGVAFSAEMLLGTNHPGMLPEYRQGQLDPSKSAATPLPPQAMAMIESDLRFCGYPA